MGKGSMAGRQAVVTGAAQGIGRAIAERLLSAGARVCLWDADGTLVAEVAKELGENAFAEAVDVADPDSIAAVTRSSLSAMGGIDILVNNAGISGPNAPTWEYPIEEWRRVIEINLNGVFYCCNSVVPTMREAGYGRIVNIASVAGKEGNPNAPAYSAAKAGVIGLTKSLGKELADTEIRVNCVTPAVARTRIFDQMTEEHIDYMLSKIPRNRFVDLEEVASLVTWLSSEECSYSTGAVFDISGGRATY